ncbi:MAG: DUF1858 domain-containing protein, partial [Halanaerobiales bacterium]
NQNTIIGDLIKEYPFLKEFLPKLSPKFKKLNNSIVFKTMGSVATLEMISERGGFHVEDLIDKIVEEIEIQQ